MPTYPELQAEYAWLAEVEPPTLAALAEQLRQHYDVDRIHIGSKGDNNHLYGYHRSRRWVLSSRWSAYGSGDYSVQAQADREGDNDWLCALDINPGSVDELIAMCQRLDAAVRAGRVPQLREWYGNADGDRYVDGWDSLAGRAATSDSSHLWHLHLSFYRGRANDDHTDLFQILTATKEAQMGWFAQDTEGRIWLANADLTAIHRIDGTEEQIVSDRQYWRGIIGVDPVEGFLAEGGVRAVFDPRVLASGVFGADLTPRKGGGGGGSGPVDLTDAAVEQVAAAVVDEQAQRLND